MQPHQKPRISVLSVGEGQKRGSAAMLADKLQGRHKVVAVDLLKPDYKIPHGMEHITGNAFAFLKRCGISSIGTIRDDFFFPHALAGEKIKAIEEMSAPPPEFDRDNVIRYVKLVKRALVPKGKFIVTIPLNMADATRQILLEQNFRIVASRELQGSEVNA